MGYSKQVRGGKSALTRAERNRIDDKFQDDSGELDPSRVAQLAKCDLIGDQIIAKHMGVTVRAMRKRLMPPNSYYHIERVNVSAEAAKPLYVLGTAANSAAAGNTVYRQHVAKGKDSSNLLRSISLNLPQ